MIKLNKAPDVLNLRDLELQHMTLSRVTEKEGLNGLVERFVADIRVLSEPTQERLNQCLVIALESHKADTYRVFL